MFISKKSFNKYRERKEEEIKKLNRDIAKLNKMVYFRDNKIVQLGEYLQQRETELRLLKEKAPN